VVRFPYKHYVLRTENSANNSITSGKTFFLPDYAKHWHTVVLRSEIPSGMCVKLRTAAASNNRYHASQSLIIIACLLAPRIYIFVLRAHPVGGESHNQRNATGEVATVARGTHRLRADLLKRGKLF